MKRIRKFVVWDQAMLGLFAFIVLLIIQFAALIYITNFDLRGGK